MSNEKLSHERYQRRTAPSRGRVIALGATLLSLFLAWAVWVTFFSPQTANPMVQGYEVLDSQETIVRFSVLKPNDRAALCAVEVLSNSYAVVGYEEVVVPAESSEDDIFEVTVNTTGLGVTGLVETCTLK